MYHLSPENKIGTVHTFLEALFCTLSNHLNCFSVCASGLFFFLKTILGDVQSNYFISLKYCFSFLTNYHALDGLKQHKLTLLQLWRQMSKPGFPGLELVSADCVPRRLQGRVLPLACSSPYGAPFPAFLGSWPLSPSPRSAGPWTDLPCHTAFFSSVPRVSLCLPCRILGTAFRACPDNL